MSNVTSNKDPLENIVMTFDFSPELYEDETISSIVSVTVEVSAGVDPHPMNIIGGIAGISKDGLAVLQPIHGGLDQVNYNVKCLAQTTNPEKLLAVTGILPVRHQ